MADYFKQREKQVVKHTELIKEDLPPFCDEFFIGVEARTSPLTRQGYSYDLRIFFDFLTKKVPHFKNIEIKDIIIDIINRVVQINTVKQQSINDIFVFDEKFLPNCIGINDLHFRDARTKRDIRKIDAVGCHKSVFILFFHSLIHVFGLQTSAEIANTQAVVWLSEHQINRHVRIFFRELGLHTVGMSKRIVAKLHENLHSEAVDGAVVGVNLTLFHQQCVDS